MALLVFTIIEAPAYGWAAARSVAGFAISAVLLAALGLTTAAVVLLASGFVSGLALEQFGIAWETSMQEHIPAEKLARVYSYDALGSLIAIPIGQVAAGPLADVVGARTALLIASGVIVASVLGMLLSRSVRTLEHHAATPEAVDSAEAVPLPAT